jgi:DNA modification methylase
VVLPDGAIPAAAPHDSAPSFDVELANALARLEAFNKHLYRPNSYLHKWWARRCGSTFRLILKHLGTDPARRGYYAPGGLEGKVVLDPMLGGGTTLHEAIRLGASVIGADIDPIPVLQARATLSALPPERLEEAFNQFHAALRSALAPLYTAVCPECGRDAELRFALHGLRQACDCGTRRFVDSTILRHQPDGSLVRICPGCYRVGAGTCCEGTAGPVLLLEKGARRCGGCGSPYRGDRATPYYRRYELLVTVVRCPEHGLCFTPPSPSDLANLRGADRQRAGLGFNAADFRVEPGPKSADLLRRGIRTYLDLFSSRQLLYLRHAIDLLPAFDPLVRLNLALLVSTSLEFNSMLCGYKGADRRRPGAIRHTFSHHAYSFPYTALENNPLYPERASGTLQNLFNDRLRRARRWAMRPTERVISRGSVTTMAVAGEVDAGTEVRRAADLGGERRFLLIQGSSAALPLAEDSVDYVVTDPPYFDSVQYSDLAAFFRVWLKQLAPADAGWDYDRSAAAVDPLAGGSDQYEQVLGAIFAECHRVLRKERGLLIFTFHHWNPKGWAALTRALQHGGFVLVDRHVVHSENPASVHVVNLKALVDDAILILAPRETGPAREWPRPPGIDHATSATFCRDCATALGWMLAAGLPAAAIDREWHLLMGEPGAGASDDG